MVNNGYMRDLFNKNGIDDYGALNILRSQGGGARYLADEVTMGDLPLKSVNTRGRNKLRELYDAGLITDAELSASPLGVVSGFAESRQAPVDDFKVDPSKEGFGALYDEKAGKFRSGGYIRDESTGQVTTFASPERQRPRGVRTFGVDLQAGAIKDLGAAPIDGDPVDYSFGDGGRQGVKKVMVPGLGEGVMGKDGFVYGRDNAGNPIWRAQAFSQQQEMANYDQDLKRQKLIAETQNLRTGGPQKPVYDSERGAWIHPDGYVRQVQGLPQTQKQIDAGIQADKSMQSGEMMLGKIRGMVGERDAEGNLIGDSQAHPGFETSVGMGLGGITKYIPGTDAANFRARYDEIKGAAFLQAFEQLKGGGAITEVEGKKATDAITRMNMSQSEKEFVTAAKEFENVVKTAMSNAQRSKGGQAAQAGGMRFGGLPNAAGFRGKRIRDDSTGRILVSDGNQWVPQ